LRCSRKQETPLTVSQSAEIAQLMNLYRAYNKKNDLADGYRLQIMFSNDRNEAYNAKSKLYKQFPRESCYVIYEQPYYKLRVGDYIKSIRSHRLC
jgi:hypothetical protein